MTAGTLRTFFNEVVNGTAPNHAAQFLADEVTAHVVRGGQVFRMTLTPPDVLAHIQRAKAFYAEPFLKVDAIIGEGDEWVVRWTQFDGPHPVLCGSTVLHMRDGKITAYATRAAHDTHQVAIAG